MCGKFDGGSREKELSGCPWRVYFSRTREAGYEQSKDFVKDNCRGFSLDLNLG